MTEAIGSAELRHLLQSKVTAWLGNGLEIKVPPEVLGPDRTGFCYRPTATRAGVTALSTRNTWFAHFTCPSVGPGKALAKGPLEYGGRARRRQTLSDQAGRAREESWESFGLPSLRA